MRNVNYCKYKYYIFAKNDANQESQFIQVRRKSHRERRQYDNMLLLDDDCMYNSTIPRSYTI